MTRLEVPLRHHVLWSTGDLVLRAYVDLLINDGRGNWRLQTFRVDCASDMSTFPAYAARQLGIALPQSPSPIVHVQIGLEVRSGYLPCRIASMDPIDYVFPCFFLGDPNAPPDPNSPPSRLPRSLLGLSGVVDHIRLTFDGRPAGPQAPHGRLIVEMI